MIEFQLNIDISDRFENAVKALADALVMREKLHHEYAQGLERVIFSRTPNEQREGGPEKDPTPAESEPTEVTPEPTEVTPEPTEVTPEPTEVTPEPTEGEKPQKKACAKAQKIAPERVAQEVTPEPTEVTPEPTEVTPEKAPEPTEVTPEPTEVTPEPTEVTPEPTEVTPEPTEVTPEPTEVTPEPTEVTPEPTEPEKAQEAVKNEDPMKGMNLMQAVKAITDELRARGVEMADANARVRRRANELGLSYSSFTCLVKAIGYTEARRVVLGE